MPDRDPRLDAVDALLSAQDRQDLPAPAERGRLRRAADLTQRQVADALGVRTETIWAWERGRSEPRPPHRAAYAHLLEQITARLATEPAQGE
jgi:DNA-binding transcriptional regulator YiaG